MRHGAVAAGLLSALLLASCSVDGDGDSAASSTAAPTTIVTPPGSDADSDSAPPVEEAGPFVPEPAVFHDCGGGEECTTVEVPLDYADPGGERIGVAVRRVPAGDPDQRIGSLLVNPGGPGASGTEFVAGGLLFDASITRRFDVVGFDPRGVGDSSPITCGDGLVEAFQALDSDPDDEAEQAALDDAAEAIAEDCRAESGALLAHVGTIDVVRDMESIRQALGEETISYMGFSYGTLLGEIYAEMFPAGARAIGLDGVVDPAHDFREFLRTQTEGFERTMADVFAGCDADPRCPSQGGAAAYDEIAARVEADPLPAGDGAVVGPGDLATAGLGVTYAPHLWPLFYSALADGLAGNGTALRDLAEDYRDFGGFTSYAAVECVDSEHPVGGADFQEFARELEAISPRFGASIANELLPCAYWPVEPVGDPAEITAPGAPPILVIGNTGDAATPFEQAERVAASLSTGRLLTYEGEGHTSYGLNACVDDAVTAFLVDLALPEVGTVCR
ncbi:alpha/beta hydrolase [soil metagenome]